MGNIVTAMMVMLNSIQNSSKQLMSQNGGRMWIGLIRVELLKWIEINPVSEVVVRNTKIAMI